jgi:hypothetical protein
MSVVQATQEVEIGGSWLESNQGKVIETLSEKEKKLKQKDWGCGSSG